MTDKTVKINVDGSEAKNLQASLRQSSENLARDMIRSSRAYSTSAKEVAADIEKQIKAIERRNKLDAEFQRIRIDSLRGSGAISQSQYQTQKTQIGTDVRTDQLQLKLLRELIDTIKITSKEEIREDRRNVEKRIADSKTVGRLGVSGDEFEALSETFQQEGLGKLGRREHRQGNSFARYIGVAGAYGGMAADGNIGGMAAMGGRSAVGAMSGMGGGALAATGIGALILATIGAAWMGDKKLYQDARSYAVASQSGVGGGALFSARDRFSGMGFSEIGMKTSEGMNFYSNVLKATGGSRLESQAAMLAGITRSRDISPDLLNQTLGFSRYGGGGQGGANTVAVLEQALRRMYPDEFRRKLVQLPEMMGVYNSLAQQMLQTTGSVNQAAISSFVGGVSQGFGVEGANLQRYSGGILSGMKGSSNNFIRKMQFAAIRQAYGNKSYQESLEILEDPTSNPLYMRAMASNMRGLGLRPFSSWTKSMGFGDKESREAFESNSFDKMIKTLYSGENKTGPSQTEIMNSYYSEASNFYSNAEQFEKKIEEFFTKILTNFGLVMESGETISKAVSSIDMTLTTPLGIPIITRRGVK